MKDQLSDFVAPTTEEEKRARLYQLSIVRVILMKVSAKIGDSEDVFVDPIQEVAVEIDAHIDALKNSNP